MRTVEIYTKPACIPCKVTKRELDTAGVPYTEKSAVDYVDFLKRLGAYAAPVVIIYRDGQAIDWWCTYRPDQIQNLANTWWQTNNGDDAA